MLFNSIFRERALEKRQRQEPLDDRLQITAPHEWLLISVVGVIFVAVIVYGAIGTVERSVSYDAVLVRPGERHPVTAPASGTVIEVRAEVGDTVEPGQVLARVRTPADQQWESAAHRLTELFEDGGARADAASAELLRLLSLATNTAADGGFAVGGDIVSLVGGEVMTLDLEPGSPVIGGAPVALVRIADSGPPQALALAAPGEAARLEVGMAAEVHVAAGSRDGDETEFAARVAAVSERPVTPPEWLAELGLAAPEDAHLLRVAFPDGAPVPAVDDGAAGSVRIVLGRSSFVRLLAPRGRD